MDCVFCKIAIKEIPADIILEDDKIVVFKDIRPKAPIHLLVIPKKHIGPVSELGLEDSEIVSRLVFKAREAAAVANVLENGYRLIFNVGKDAGMEVDHLHLHMLGGKPLKAFFKARFTKRSFN